MTNDQLRNHLVEKLQVLKNQLDYGIIAPFDYDKQEREIIRQLKQVNNSEWAAGMVGKY